MRSNRQSLTEAFHFHIEFMNLDDTTSSGNTHDSSIVGRVKTNVHCRGNLQLRVVGPGVDDGVRNWEHGAVWAPWSMEFHVNDRSASDVRLAGIEYNRRLGHVRKWRDVGALGPVVEQDRTVSSVRRRLR